MTWLTSPSWQGIGSIAAIVAAVAGVVSIPFFCRHKMQKNYARVVVERFVFLFKSHGVERTQIHRFFGNDYSLSLPKVSSDEKLLHALDDDILLSTTCERFGIRRGWLDGRDERIYDALVVYKDLPEFVRLIRELKEDHPEEFCFLYAYKSAHTSPDLFKSKPEISLVFAAPITDIDERTIYRYYPLLGTFPWDDSTSRFHLYAFFTLVFSIPRLVLKGRDVSHKLIGELAEGKILPETVKYEGIWHPEDYAFSSISHDMPMETKEITAFWDYIKKHGWLEYFEDDIITRPK